MFVVVLLLVLALVLYFQLYNNRVKDFPVYPGNLPFIGHTYLLFGDEINLFNQIKNVGNHNVLKNGGRTRLQLGLESYYVFSDPEDCEILMNSHQTEKLWIYNFTKGWLGEGLGTASSSRWARTHKLLYPMFSSKLINGYLPVFNKQARRLVDIFADKDGKGAFNHEHTVMLIGFETICQNVFGVEVSNNAAQEYDRALIGIMNLCVERVKAPWFYRDFMFQHISPLKRKQDEHLHIINQFTDEYIEKQKARINNNTMEDKHLGEYRPFIDYVVKVAVENNFSHDQIRHEISTLLFTGYETSSVVLVYVMMLLGQHTDVQNKAYKELQKVFGDSDRDVEKSDIPKLEYLEAILRETLRYSPVIPVLGRTNNVAFKLKKLTLPAGSNIILNVYSLLRHPAWGPDADQFVPERWLDPATLPKNANLFAAFGLGKRNCIGKEYAMISMKTTLVHLLRRYKISSDMSKLVVKMEILAKPASGQHIILESRNV